MNALRLFIIRHLDREGVVRRYEAIALEYEKAAQRAVAECNEMKRMAREARAI